MMSEEMIDVIIIGGGISGLVSALCFNRCGLKVRIYEQTVSVEPIGYGISLQPYCVKVLHELGLENELNEISIQSRRILSYSRDGEFLFENLRGLDAGFHWPVYSVHRADFHQLLLRHVVQKLGQSSVHFSQKLIQFISKPDYVQVDFINPTNGQLKSDKAKLLIGADGINSTVRKFLYPDEGLPIWKGLNLWRGLTSVDKMFLDGQTTICIGNPNDIYCIIYPISKNLINWACVHRVKESSWTRQGNIEDILPLISSMKVDFIDINQLIKLSTTANEFPMTDRDLIPQWTFNNVTLMGDAAHPMYPFGANGASQAILDARQLYLSFKKFGVTCEALQEYEKIRRPLTDKFVLSAREYGPDKILQLVDEYSQNKFYELSDIISSEDIQSRICDSKQMTAVNIEQLNKESPLF
jgi:2-polyprenyl-6-methoxyphenol hydroxylase-like FAD-dependent oxidoreductase